MKWKRQNGAAYLVALVLVAIATVLAVGALDRGYWSQRQTLAQLRIQQAQQLAQGLEDWALAILRRDLELDGGKDGPADIWNQTLPATTVPGGLIQGQLRELSGRFNINSLVAGDGRVNPLARQRFIRLLQLLQLDPGIADRAIDWLDADSVPQPLGAEDAAYIALGQGHVAANGNMAHPSELRLLAGMDETTYDALAPYIYAAPDPATAININTASLAVLRSLGDNISASDAAQWRRQMADGFASVADFLRIANANATVVQAEGLSVSSHYFISRSQIAIEEWELSFESLLRRQGNQYDVLFRRQVSW